MVDAFCELASSMAKDREFAKCDFQMGAEEETIMSPPHKRALATWQTYYHTTINGTGQIVNRLLPLVQQCESIDA